MTKNPVPKVIYMEHSYVTQDVGVDFRCWDPTLARLIEGRLAVLEMPQVEGPIAYIRADLYDQALKEMAHLKEHLAEYVSKSLNERPTMKMFYDYRMRCENKPETKKG